MITPELKNEIKLYLANKQSLDDFQDWLEPRMYRFLSADPDSQDVHLLTEFELVLHDMEDDLRTEEELRIVLGRYLREEELVTIRVPKQVYSWTSSTVPIYFVNWIQDVFRDEKRPEAQPGYILPGTV